MLGLILFLFLFLHGSTTAQIYFLPQVPIVRQDHQVPFFSSIQFSGPIDVVYRPGTSELVSIEARSDILPYISAVVQPTNPPSLQISLLIPGPRHWRYNVGTIRVTVTSRTLSSLEMSGTGHFMAVSPINAENFRLTTTGSGDATISVTANMLTVRLYGAGNAHVSGQATEATLLADGAGTLHGENLMTVMAKATASGAGQIYVNVRNYLSATVVGVGSVRYRGNPQVVRSVSGVGTVTVF
ncbi:hypothetical protein BV898_12240 [Hypsibius exemplaris]|uniref:Putative auto-transporter adhesin head GIN domain-containing protein n=1 Tax=Hypsibius exemplaris TaxID=2072580 RepID=A0A1W0WE88_HYPEX|nr:hypothetical protein BV898_12240 [Hypsibius exemplaris]